ncbi:uncharacterized protein LOC130647878 [Hydractinia symbiolongicarpus]|uniref:uncharacterized protein LOC130647878 n=1 Tax=Hydractinia symbiolongicarpus TaxID=13093 RepID=UPI00254E3E5F|nr:uncharacterized protein LOC130647878 [Hydractinia symbiolongicarpus]
MKSAYRIVVCTLLLEVHYYLITGKILRLSCGFYSDLSLFYKDSRLTVGILDTYQVEDDLSCVKKCILNGACQSINYNDYAKTCELLKNTTAEDNLEATYATNWTHYETDPNNQEVGDVCSSTSPCKGHYCEDICEPPGFNCTCRNETHGERCDKLQHPAKSCKWINENHPTLKNGYYWVQLQQPTLVYCDMETLGGGWTEFGNVVQKGSIPDQNLTNVINSDNISLLNDVSTGRFLLTVSGLGALRKFINFTQLRFYCHKPWHNRTIHIATTNDFNGKKVVDYFSGVTETLPPSCHSYEILPDDTSYIASQCMNWALQQWSTSHKDNNKLNNHFIWIRNHHHVNLYDERLECDDYYKRDKAQYNSSGEWRFFVR